MLGADFTNATNVYIAEPAGPEDAAFEAFQAAQSDGHLGAAEFQMYLEKFFCTFRLKGETTGEPTYKSQLLKLQSVFGADNHRNLMENTTAATTSLTNSQVLPSICLDLEHLKKWSLQRADEAPPSSASSVETLNLHWGEVLMSCLRRHPLKYLPAAENAVRNAYTSLIKDTAGGSPEAIQEELPPTQIEIISGGAPIKIRDLKANEVESLVVIPGIVVQAAKPQHKAFRLKLQCKDCKAEKMVRIPPWRQGVNIPRICEASHQKAAEEQKCSLDPYIFLSDESLYGDVQTVKIQELPEDVPTGDMPRHLMLNCPGTLCGRLAPGDRVLVIGVYSAFDRQSSSAGSGGASLRSSYVHVVGIEEDPEGGRGRSKDSLVSWSYREEEEFRRMAQDPYVIQKIRDSIAPAIYGLDDVKLSIACLLFGGAQKRLPDNTKLRGDLNVLLLGDPSTAKSQFLKFVDKCAPIAIYTSGKGSSAAGLTAAIVRDSAGNFALEGGAMVLADGGVVCIDEFDKMRDDDRVAIHEAMEQQTISIAKAGITTILNTKCAVLAAANPTFGSYDDTKDTTEQHNFETTILSRFDLIWLIRDTRDVEKDQTIARHVFALHAGTGDGREDSAPIGAEKLRGYIDYCRRNCDPRLSLDSAKKLENYYVEVRANCRDDNRRRRDQIPITVRQLESLARIAESLARMSLSSVVEERHVDEAIRLFQLATVEASKSTLTRENLTPGERQLIRAAEEAILQRLPVGGRAAKSSIVRDLALRGHEVGMVSRAIRILIQKGTLEERGGGSVRRLPTAD